MDMETNMSDLTRLEIDAITGKKTVIAYTAEEIAEHDAMVAQVLAEEKAREDAIIAKALAEAKLAALGLTTDDLKALGLGGN